MDFRHPQPAADLFSPLRIAGEFVKTINRLAILLLRPILVLFMGLLLMLQTLSFPGQFRHMAEESPQDAHLRWPLTIIAGTIFLCLELVAFSVWKLLALVKNHTILTNASRKWMNLIIFAIALAWAIVFSIFVTIALQADDPGAPVMLMFIQMMIAIIGMIAIVIRGVFLEAIDRS